MRHRDQPTALIKAFGRAVRQQREALSLSQEDFAFRCELDRTYISGIERGVRNPTLRTMARLAAALGTRVDKLTALAQELLESGRK